MKSLFLILLTFILVCPAQNLYVKRIEVGDELFPDFVLLQATTLIRERSFVNEESVRCVVTELKNSGIVRDLKFRWLSVGNKDEFILRFDPIYSRDTRSLTISEIDVSGFTNLNKDRFLQRLSKSGVGVGMRLVKYPFQEMRNKILEAVDQTFLDKGLDGANSDSWLEIRRSGKGHVKLIVSSQMKVCESISPVD